MKTQHNHISCDTFFNSKSSSNMIHFINSFCDEQIGNCPDDRWEGRCGGGGLGEVSSDHHTRSSQPVRQRACCCSSSSSFSSATLGGNVRILYHLRRFILNDRELFTLFSPGCNGCSDHSGPLSSLGKCNRATQFVIVQIPRQAWEPAHYARVKRRGETTPEKHLGGIKTATEINNSYS